MTTTKTVNFFIMSPSVFKKITDALDKPESDEDIIREAKILLIGKSSITQVGSIKGVPVYLDENMASDQILIGYNKIYG